jgi:hypothetical protein
VGLGVIRANLELSMIDLVSCFGEDSLETSFAPRLFKILFFSLHVLSPSGSPLIHSSSSELNEYRVLRKGSL